MQEKEAHPQTAPVPMAEKVPGKQELKNQNPNHNHSTKKEALGPNTKR